MDPNVAEFVGTLLLVLLGNGVVANVVLPQTKGHDAGWVVISAGWGMAVFIAVWCVGPYSGAHLNPAVTIGLAVSGGFEWSLVTGYLIAQMLGAIAGAALVYLFYRDHYAICDDAGAKLATFSTAPAIRRISSNLFSEVVGTAVLVFGVLLAVNPTIEVAGETASAMTLGLGTLGALPVGLLVFAIGMSLGGTTGYAINPARDLGPRIAHALLPIPGKGNGDWGYALIPVAGPILGGIVAAVLFRTLVS
jgi:glycerol uptake facilitator protein